MVNLIVLLFVFGNAASYLSKEGHSEVCAQQPFASMHHLHHFSIGTVEGIIQVCQFLFRKNRKVVEMSVLALRLDSTKSLNPKPNFVYQLFFSENSCLLQPKTAL